VRSSIPVWPLLAAGDRTCDFPVGFVFAERIHRPDRRWDPTDNRDLKQQANDAGERPANREELEPRQENGKQEAHGFFP
jgi:hypothetical protein